MSMIQGLVLLLIVLAVDNSAGVLAQEQDTPAPSCRKNPAWNTDPSMFERCSEETPWNLTDLYPFWLDPPEEYWADTFPHTTQVESCITKAFESWRHLQGLGILPSTPDEILESKVVKTHNDSDGTVLLVQVENAFTEEEAFGVKALAGCIRQFDREESFQHRDFEGYGGNDVTFLAFKLQRFLPGVAQRLYVLASMAFMEMKSSHIDLPDPTTQGIRTSEHLNYGEFQQGLAGHVDGGSTYTVLGALSDPKDYEGGEYFLDLDDDPGQVLFKPDRLSALVFLSEAFHGVKAVPSGKRETFANELWYYGDVPDKQNRPELLRWEAYMDMLKKDPNALMPSDEQVKQFRAEGNSIWEDRYNNYPPDEQEDENRSVTETTSCTHCDGNDEL